MSVKKRNAWAVTTGLLMSGALAGPASAQAPQTLPPVTPATALPAPHLDSPTMPAPAPGPASVALGIILSDSDVGLPAPCTTCQPRAHGSCLGYPQEFIATPLGASLHAYGQAEVAKHEALSMALYDYDFVEDCPQLNARGLEQLACIARRLPTTFHCITIEPIAGPPGLAEQRRLFVINLLNQGSFPVPAQRVVVAPPGEIGLSGTDAVLIYRNQLGNTLAGPTLARPASNLGGVSGLTPPPPPAPAGTAIVP